jgi:hypothetical protein
VANNGSQNMTQKTTIPKAFTSRAGASRRTCAAQRVNQTLTFSDQKHCFRGSMPSQPTIVIRLLRSYLFPIISDRCITLLAGINEMARGRTNIGTILVTAIVFVLLCGIVAGEFPELLSLTDNATNDFTLVRTKSAHLPALLHASSHLPAADMNCNALVPSPLFLRLSPFQEAASVPSVRSTLNSVLRT